MYKSKQAGRREVVREGEESPSAAADRIAPGEEKPEVALFSPSWSKSIISGLVQ